MDKHLKVVFFGTSSFAVPVLSRIKQENWLIAVVTTPDSKVGRQHSLTPSPVKAYLQGQPGQTCPIFTPEKFDQEVIENLKQLEPDLFVLASYGRMLPQEILDIPKYGNLNVHPSLLPKYRGPSPLVAPILNGDKTSGVTIIKMDEKMDHGPVLNAKEIPLSDKETFESLSIKLFTKGAELLIKIIPDFVAGKIELIPQDHTQATFTHLIKKEDGYFDIENPPQPEKLDQMIRAYYPWPNVWTKWPFDKAQGKNNKIVKFYPGKIIQIEGKKPISLENFLRGYPGFPLHEI